ncbi:murein L,D-transpeptidase catalytic domain family protein [Mucilaginibacter myungsuensis]
MISFGFAKKSSLTVIDSSNIKTTATANSSAKIRFVQYVDDIYSSAKLKFSGLDSAVFEKALVGYYNLKVANMLPLASSVITVVDFNKPSTQKRMWIVDVLNKKLLLNTWVAHGQGSGNDMADAFSNNNESHQSSLGFYVTDDTYVGKHGRSLRLNGVDRGFNDQARNRAIVLHAADYVSQGTINQLGRLGRSHGCPAVAPELCDQIINTVKNKNMLFITGRDQRYTSKFLNEDSAAQFALMNDTNPIVLKEAIAQN